MVLLIGGGGGIFSTFTTKLSWRLVFLYRTTQLAETLKYVLFKDAQTCLGFSKNLISETSILEHLTRKPYWLPIYEIFAVYNQR